MTETIEIRGVEVPRLGFGTCMIEGDDGAVRDALEIGYADRERVDALPEEGRDVDA